MQGLAAWNPSGISEETSTIGLWVLTMEKKSPKCVRIDGGDGKKNAKYETASTHVVH